MRLSRNGAVAKEGLAFGTCLCVVFLLCASIG